MFKIIDKKKKGLCKAHGCTKAHTKNDIFCSKHRHRYNKEFNPVSYTYNLLKSNAKRRGKDFTLTLDEFNVFCEKTNYIELKGKKKHSATVDRIDQERGYHADNIQVLSLSLNVKKYYEEAPF